MFSRTHFFRAENIFFFLSLRKNSSVRKKRKEMGKNWTRPRSLSISPFIEGSRIREYLEIRMSKSRLALTRHTGLVYKRAHSVERVGTSGPDKGRCAGMHVGGFTRKTTRTVTYFFGSRMRGKSSRGRVFLGICVVIRYRKVSFPCPKSSITLISIESANFNAN